MIDIQKKKVLVVGLGVSGFSASKLLAGKALGVKLTEASRTPEIEERAKELSDMGVEVELGGHTEDFSRGADLVVASPGVDEDSLPLAVARSENTPVIGELELGTLFTHAKIIAITGTNGKSTTTELIGKVLADSGMDAVVCGNIGNPLTGEIDRIKAESVVVLEVSSFQLSRIREFRPYIAILLNITEDHYERHGNLDNYRRDKFRIFTNQTSGDWAVLNSSFRGDPLVFGVKSRIAFFGSQEAEASLCEEGVFLTLEGAKEMIIRKEEVPIKGKHNLENAACAALVASIMGVKGESIRRSIMEFEGLKHRFENVGAVEGVEFIDDSKATNIDATKRALQSVDKKIVLIAGGRDKGGDYSSALELVKEKVKAMVLIGEARDVIGSAFGDTVPVRMAESLPDAVTKAYGEASEGEVVMLSPMCSSFDMFSSYKERGEVFQQAVQSLKEQAIHE